MSPGTGVAGRLRLALRGAALVGWLALCLALYGLRAILPGRNWVPRLFLGGTLRIVGARLRVLGERAPAPCFLIANHLSWMDILALAGATGTAFVAHDGLAGNPALRFLCRLNRTVFIARGERGSVAGQVEQVQEGLHESGVLTLFPEGTCDDGVTLLPFKSSLLAAVDGGDQTVAIQPVWIDYGAEAGEIAWFGDEGGLANFTRVLARARPVQVTLHMLAPLGPQERQDRKTIAAAAREAIEASALGTT
ncbi:1-acyl-sn-glycerol-3-phosphate acyltransferase [Novosphingobium sp. 9U]|uniref:lysophospholipid acyltransferase family protein n=1 Tax=Novosphingobium sp. 9U TaxID=2653158 RepID=UPI0012F31D1C|nr:lysophospholipid acyltransferase family protein [Novosphingobium sp. 9U]VWX46948.1 1-acyl-sn-glycerol-3-phosphate acyltransferase [Novosphingobium sp. 9U]